MKKLFRSLFRSSNESDSHAEQRANEGPAAAPAPVEPPHRGAPRSADEIFQDLCRCVSKFSADPIAVDDIDGSLHMYDAGYVTSITAADLLAHVEKRYGLFVPETDLVGRLRTLDALSRHIAESSSGA